MDLWEYNVSMPNWLKEKDIVEADEDKVAYCEHNNFEVMQHTPWGAWVQCTYCGAIDGKSNQ